MVNAGIKTRTLKCCASTAPIKKLIIVIDSVIMVSPIAPYVLFSHFSFVNCSLIR